MATRVFQWCTFFAVIFAVGSVIAQVTPPAVLTPTDPALRLWLRADTLVTAGLAEGDPITQWVDQSQYGTILAPRTDANPNGPLGGFPVEESPHFNYADINGNSVPTVRFDRDGSIFSTGDPNIDGSGSTDRLYQTNNLAPNFDPLDIGDGSSLTTFIVFNPDVTTALNEDGSPTLGYQCVFGKRGSTSSVYDMAIKNFPNFGNFVFVSYDSVEQYHSGIKPTEKVWHTTSYTIEDMPGAADVDLIKMFDDESQSATTKMVDIGVTKANGTPQPTIANRNASTPEPFGIGAHSQNCCGEGETFAGNIAEIIIFARTLSTQEFADVEDYLDAKYFVAAPAGVPGDYNDNGTVDAADYVLWRDNSGQTFTLANENPAAATPGVVDAEDYDYWRSRFGATSGSGVGSAAAVPEPSILVLLMASLPVALFRTFRMRQFYCRLSVVTTP